jgi:hypothetical protein
MAQRWQNLVKLIECTDSKKLEQEVNLFLQTVSIDNLIDIQYHPLQTPMATLFTAMIFYKSSIIYNEEIK